MQIEQVIFIAAITFILGMLLALIIARRSFMPKWVHPTKDDRIQHDGLIIIQYVSGDLNIYRGYSRKPGHNPDRKLRVSSYLKL